MLGLFLTIIIIELCSVAEVQALNRARAPSPKQIGRENDGEREGGMRIQVVVRLQGKAFRQLEEGNRSKKKKRFLGK